MLETEQIYLKHQIFREIFTDFWKNWQKKGKYQSTINGGKRKGKIYFKQ